MVFGNNWSYNKPVSLNAFMKAINFSFLLCTFSLPLTIDCHLFGEILSSAIVRGNCVHHLLLLLAVNLSNRRIQERINFSHASAN